MLRDNDGRYYINKHELSTKYKLPATLIDVALCTNQPRLMQGKYVYPLDIAMAKIRAHCVERKQEYAQKHKNSKVVNATGQLVSKYSKWSDNYAKYVGIIDEIMEEAENVSIKKGDCC